MPAVLTAFDYLALAIMGLSAVRGAWCGFVSEALGLIGWAAAFVLACRYVGWLVPYMPAHWSGGALTQWLLAFAAIVFSIMLIAGLTKQLFTRLVAVSGLGSIDRSLGLMFGLVRGGVLVLLLVALAGFTELPKQAFWRDALLRAYAEQGVREVKPLLPHALADHLHL